MKVCHFVCSKGLGRGEIYVDLVNALAELDELELCLIAPDGAKYLNRLDKSVQVYLYKSKNSRFNPNLYIELYGIFKEINPKIVHTHFSKASQIFYYLNIFLKTRYVGTKHNDRKGEIYNRLNNVIAVSRVVADSIQNNNVKVIYNGILPEKIKQCDRPDVFTIVSIGRLEKIKGFELLIQECRKLTIPYRLLIYGDGKEKKSLQKLIDQNSLGDKISLKGFSIKISEIMHSSHLVVVSSEKEGFGLTIIEAMFYAPMLISTYVGAAREFIDKKLLVLNGDFASKIEDIYFNYEKYKEVFDCNKINVRDKFLFDNIAIQHLQEYKRILENE